MRNSNSGHVCHSPQHSSSPVYVSDSGASSTGDMPQDSQGRSLYMFPPFALLNKVIQKLKSTQGGKVILIALWWPSKPWFPHLCLCVDHPRIILYHRDLLSQQGKSYHLHAWRLSCSTTNQQNFQKRPLD